MALMPLRRRPGIAPSDSHTVRDYPKLVLEDSQYCKSSFVKNQILLRCSRDPYVAVLANISTRRTVVKRANAAAKAAVTSCFCPLFAQFHVIELRAKL